MADKIGRPERATGRRGDVLRMLKQATHPLSTADIADRLGMHPNTVRFHMDTLLANGQVERVSVQRRVPGRPPQMFQAVAGMDPTGPRHYRLLAEVLADTLATDPDWEGRAIKAGRIWGRRQCEASGTEVGVPDDPIDGLVALLGEFGFAPERGRDDEQLAEGARQISLRNCPFLELAVDRPQVACLVHLGLMQGAMEAWHSAITVERLDAFVDPDRCVAHLTEVEQG